MRIEPGRKQEYGTVDNGHYSQIIDEARGNIDRLRPQLEAFMSETNPFRRTNASLALIEEATEAVNALATGGLNDKQRAWLDKFLDLCDETLDEAIPTGTTKERIGRMREAVAFARAAIGKQPFTGGF